MNHKASDEDSVKKGQTDNMAQNNDEMDEALAGQLNVDDSVSGMQHLDDDMINEDEIEKLNNDLAEAKDKYLRLVAEFENFRKRNAKERLELSQTAGREIIQSLLEVLDDSYRAEAQMNKSQDLEAIKQGILLVFNKLRNTLQQKGLKIMDSVNQPFDADLHEAITEIPAPSEDLVGKIVDDIEPGYYLNDKLIRHAKVVVGK